MSVHLFGIRHHGPGCARALCAALATLAPDILLVEGPPDAQDILPLLLHEAMQPPVALLIYVHDEPQHAIYYPFAHFSPEWQALRYALQQGIPARFIDLPQTVQLANRPIEEETHGRDQSAPTAQPEQRPDPLAMLAQAAGYADHEQWWEQQIEQRHDTANLFAGITEAMSALRTDLTPESEQEARREAHMRQMIRAAQKEGFQRIAVVCGAWHTPALSNLADAQADDRVLRGLKRIKVTATWIPWTNSRLSYRSGYGAGITSPGWYEHLWADQEHGQLTSRWITRAAHLLRAEGLDASSASIIEAIRLGETLAALRDLPMPGMSELHEAIATVLCHGNDAPMQLIRERMEIGERLGAVSPDAPTVPLQRDLESRQHQARLKTTTDAITLDLDLRNATDRARSQLLHQLRLLGIEWGKPQQAYGKLGTFHELWHVQWHVEFLVKLIEMNVWGNTIEEAATAFVCHQADTLQELPRLTSLLDQVIVAELTGAVEHLLQIVQERAAITADVQHLMNALPPLARIARYGNVRQTKTEHMLPIIAGLFERILVALPAACSALDDEAARTMIASINAVQESLNILNQETWHTEWQSILRRLAENDGIHGLLQGRCCRLLLEQHILDEAALQRLAGLALSAATPIAQAAAWIEGVLYGSGLLLLQQDVLWLALDNWLCNLSTETFESVLPLVRRAFSLFESPERRAMGEKVHTLHTPKITLSGSQAGETTAIHQQRAALVLPILAEVLGVTYDGNL